MAKSEQDQPNTKTKFIPPKVVSGIEAQLKTLRGASLVLKLLGENRAILAEGNVTVAGPFTHGQSLQSWVDGFRLGEERGFKNGRMEGGKEALRIVKQEQDEIQTIYILRTGMMYHAFRWAGQWVRIEDPKLPAFDMGRAINVAVERLGLTNFSIKYDDKSGEVLGGNKS